MVLLELEKTCQKPAQYRTPSQETSRGIHGTRSEDGSPLSLEWGGDIWINLHSGGLLDRGLQTDLVDQSYSEAAILLSSLKLAQKLLHLLWRFPALPRSGARGADDAHGEPRVVVGGTGVRHQHQHHDGHPAERDRNGFLPHDHPRPEGHVQHPHRDRRELSGGQRRPPPGPELGGTTPGETGR